MQTLFDDLFRFQIPFYEKIIRTVAVYAALILLLRLFGKRELGQFNPFDLVVLLTLSNALQNAIIGNDNSLVGGLLGAVTLLGVNYLVVRYFYRHQRSARLFEGHTAVLIDQGRVVQRNLERELITEDELLAVCRRQGVERFDQVEKAILETSGTINVFTRHPTRDEAFDEEVAHRLDRIEALLQSRAAGD